jgi:hypothetical protein
MPATTDLTFTLVATSTTTGVAVIPGTVQFGGGGDVRGGRVTPVVVAGLSREGSAQCIIDTTNVETTILALQSAVGHGDYAVAGTLLTPYLSYDALVDVSAGDGEDGPEVYTITWKGTVATH